SALAAVQEGEPLEEMNVLLILQKRAMQRRNELLWIPLAQGFRRDILVEQQFEPVEQFRRRGLLLEAGRLAQVEEDAQGLLDEALLDVGIMRFDDGPHRLDVGKPDVVEETAAQERVRQLFLIVRGDDDNRPARGA